MNTNIMKLLAAIAVATTLSLGTAQALDPSGLTYTSIALGQSGNTAGTNGYFSWVDVSGLDGNGRFLMTDIPTTTNSGAYALEIFTGATTSTISTLVSATFATSITADTQTGAAVDTDALSKFIRLRWTCITTTTVHEVGGQLVTHP